MIKPTLFAYRAVLFALPALLVAGCQTPAPEPPKASSASPEEIDLLLDFNSGTLPAGLETDGAAVRLASYGTEDGNVLEVTFPPEVHKPIASYTPEEPWDWSGLDEFNIAVDAKNIGDSSIQLYMGIMDTEGAFANRCVALAPGEAGTYFAVLNGRFNEIDSGIREHPRPWQTQEEMFIFRWGWQELDLSRIEQIYFFVRGTLVEKSVVIDNIRLRRNPPYDENFLKGLVDEFGQNAKQDFPVKIHSEAELKKATGRELVKLATSGPLPDRSRFGGWKDGPKLEGTGYFRAEKVDGKWWMVDPEGYLFFSHGLANVRMANLSTMTGIDFRDPSVREEDPEDVTPIDSVGGVAVSDAARKSRYVASPMRRDMFTWLPGYEDPLADHYSYRRSVHLGPMESGETFSFYRANLERRYGNNPPGFYMQKWKEVTLQRMLAWGFTSMGNWVDPAFYPNEKVPYFANGWIIGDFKTLSSPSDIWAPMPDPFDPEFVRRAKVTIDVVAEEIQGSPWCVGVFIDNEKSWGPREGTVEDRYGLILDALSKAADESPAKQAFTGLLQAKYGSVAALNEAWASDFSDWHDFADGFEQDNYTSDAAADLSAMLALLSEEYFKVVHDTLAETLPNHLYMGVRMASWGMPEETIQAAVKYSDVLSFNIYQDGIHPSDWGFLNEIDLPVIIGEFHIGTATDTGLHHAGLVQADGQADRAKMYREYMDSVAAHDMMVGAHWFQYVDSPLTGRAFDGESYNIGFVTVTDIPYPEMVEAARAFNTSLYPKRFESPAAARQTGPSN